MIAEEHITYDGYGRIATIFNFLVPQDYANPDRSRVLDRHYWYFYILEMSDLEWCSLPGSVQALMAANALMHADG